MESKVIEDERLIEMWYPVGINMIVNLPLIHIMAEHIIRLFGDKEGINLCCSGSSGAIVASIISTHLFANFIKFNIIHIKKHGEDSHSGDTTFISDESKEYPFVIVDDFMSMGTTVNWIYHRLCNRFGSIDIDALVLTHRIKETYLEFEPKIYVCEEFRPE